VIDFQLGRVDTEHGYRLVARHQSPPIVEERSFANLPIASHANRRSDIQVVIGVVGVRFILDTQCLCAGMELVVELLPHLDHVGSRRQPVLNPK